MIEEGFDDMLIKRKYINTYFWEIFIGAKMRIFNNVFCKLWNNSLAIGLDKIEI